MRSTSVGWTPAARPHRVEQLLRTARGDFCTAPGGGDSGKSSDRSSRSGWRSSSEAEAEAAAEAAAAEAEADAEAEQQQYISLVTDAVTRNYHRLPDRHPSHGGRAPLPFRIRTNPTSPCRQQCHSVEAFAILAAVPQC